MKKRLLALLLAAMCLTLLAACGKDSGDDNGTPSGEPSAPVEPSGEPAPDPTPAGVDLAAFYGTMFTDPDNSPALMELTGEMLDDLYPGLSAVSTKQCLVYTPMISAVAAEVALIEVSNSADVAAVKDILQARVDAQVAGGAWYPATIESWKNNSRIVSNGNYIMLIVWEECDGIVSRFNALF